MCAPATVRYNGRVLRRVIRSLVVAVISLAVPVQGISAVTSGQCMSLAHHDGGAAVTAHAHDSGAADGHADASHVHDDESATASNGESKSGHCGPCSACCASASITGPVSVLDVPAPASAAYSFSQYPPLGVQPSELDRPPLAL